MKFVTVFALFAVAISAEQIKVVELPPPAEPAIESLPNFFPLTVPQSILETINAKPFKMSDLRRVNLVDSPIESDDSDSLKVHFVDSPVQNDYVNFVDTPFVVQPVEIILASIIEIPIAVEAFEVQDEDNFVDAVEPVKVADISMPKSSFEAEDENNFNAPSVVEPVLVGNPIAIQAPTAAESLEVQDEDNLVDSPSVVEPVKVADLPSLLKSVRISEVPAVEPVMVGNPMDFRRIHYADPRLR